MKAPAALKRQWVLGKHKTGKLLLFPNQLARLDAQRFRSASVSLVRIQGLRGEAPFTTASGTWGSASTRTAAPDPS